MKKIYIVSSLVILLSACASVKLMNPTATDLERVQTKFPGYTLTELSHGKQLYEQNCGKCHGLKNPSSQGEAQWKTIVPRMVKKVNKREAKVDTKQEELILKYLITMSSVSGKK
jgi:mono/diheme cytochrome c family protein